MKIPPNLFVIPSGKPPAGKRTARTSADSSSNATAETMKPSVVVELISSENARAVEESRPADLRAAESVLERIKSQLSGMTREELRQVHRLQGLVHVFQG